jgi:hypothetical protein
MSAPAARRRSSASADSPFPLSAAGLPLPAAGIQARAQLMQDRENSKIKRARGEADV